MLLWLDLETTGLELSWGHRILEVAAVLAKDDDPFEPLAILPSVVRHFTSHEYILMRGLIPFEMHTENGLIEDCKNEDRIHTHSQMDDAVMKFIKIFVPVDEPLYLAGSGVHFDRAFIKQWLLQLDERLHYRHLDVSTTRELVRRIWPELVIPEIKNKRHRALDDIQDAIALGKFFADNLTPKEIAL